MATQDNDINARLRAAIKRAGARLAREAGQSKKPVNLADGKHEAALVKEKNERILTPEQTRAYDVRHPNARKQPMNLDASVYGLPKVRGYDAGGEVQMPENLPLSKSPDMPLPTVKGPGLGERVREGLQKYGKSAGDITMPKEEPDAPIQKYQGRLGWSIPEIGSMPVYDDGGEVNDHDKMTTGDQPVPRMLGSNGQPIEPLHGAETEPAPSRADLENQHIQMRRDQVNQKQDQAIQSGSLVDQGMANLAHRQLDAHEARQPQTDVAAPEFGATPAAMPDLGAPTARMRYTGPGAAKMTQGELIPEKQLPTDEYKFKQQDLDKRIEAARDAAVDANSTSGERAQAQTLADQLTLRREELKRPAATSVLGKIGRGLETAGNIAGNLVAAPEMSLIPGTALYKQRQAQGTLGRVKSDIGAEHELAETEAEQAKQTKSPWKPAAGEQFTKYDASGRPVQQLFTNENTGEQQWRDVPAAGPLAKYGAGEIPTPGGAAPAAGGEYYGTKEALKTSEKPIGDAGVKQYAEQAKSASLRVPKGYDVAPPTFSKDDTGATAADKVKDYERSVNDAILADRADKAAAARESAAESRERRAEDRKDRGVPVYAEDENGQTILTNKYMAQLKNQAYEIATPGDINKDRQATRQLNDVQLNVSRYTKAATEAAKTEPTTEDYVNMHSILNKAGALDLNIAIGEGGSIKIPILSSMIEGLNREVNSEAYHDLSPQAKSLIDGYIRSLSAVPAYQKALTGIGRSNKEMLDLELANIPNPTMKPADIQRKLGQFQENIDRASEGFPKLPGLKTAKQTRSETENQGAPSSPRPEDVVKTGKLNGQTVYQLKNGKTVDAQGNEVK
jgi:hypothetical protein